jgi:diacylglycerol kinase family enzyme
LAELAPEVDLVVTVGGDGTLGEVLSALPIEIPVAVLPMGTANVLAGDLGLPRRVPDLLRAIAAGRTLDLDTARVNGRLSFLVLGVGIDGEIVRDVGRRRTGTITKAFYVSSVLRCLWRNRPPKLRVWVDGKPVPGHWGWVLVSNLVGYGGILRLSPERVLDDGLYEVFLFARGTRRALLGYGLRGLLGRLPGRSCKMVRARRVRVESDRPVPYEVDGDFGGETPVELEVAQGRHRLIVP